MQTTEIQLKHQQQMLKDLGFFFGEVNGIWGMDSIQAKIKWEESSSFKPGVPNGGMPLGGVHPFPYGVTYTYSPEHCEFLFKLDDALKVVSDEGVVGSVAGEVAEVILELSGAVTEIASAVVETVGDAAIELGEIMTEDSTEEHEPAVVEDEPAVVEDEPAVVEDEPAVVEDEPVTSTVEEVVLSASTFNPSKSNPNKFRR